MTVYELFKVLIKRWKIIAIVTITPIIISLIFSFFIIKPTYRADASILIGPPESSEFSPYTYNDLLMYQNMVKDYEAIANSRIVAQDTINKLNLDINTEELKKNIRVVILEGTEVLVINVENKNPSQAAHIANQLVQSLKSISANIKNTDNVRILDHAIPIEKPISPNKKLNISISFLIGLVLSLGLVYLIEYTEINHLNNPMAKEEQWS